MKTKNKHQHTGGEVDGDFAVPVDIRVSLSKDGTVNLWHRLASAHQDG